MRRTALFAALLIILAGCALTRSQGVQQRSTQGPTAEQFWTAAILLQSGRAPTFEEKRHWEDDIDARIATYLRTHQQEANALTLAAFRFHKQVVVGMHREQVTILLGEPERTSTDPAEMQNVARVYWPSIRGKATEVLVYPLGWAFFLERDRVVDITQYIPPDR
jgi:hypothetical protein